MTQTVNKLSGTLRLKEASGIAQRLKRTGRSEGAILDERGQRLGDTPLYGAFLLGRGMSLICVRESLNRSGTAS